MRLKKIFIGRYKNISNFECELSDSNISAFIGNNGSGKSNLLEVVTEVFSIAKKVCEDKRSNIIVFPEIYDCEIEYEKDNSYYILKYSKSDVAMYCGDQKLLKREMNNALPESIIVYYAGETSRQASTVNSTFDVKYDERLKRSDNDSFPGYKYMDYYSIDDLSLLLLTASVFGEEYNKKLLNLLRCDDILPQVRMILKNPKGRGQNNADTYWNAKGFVQSFLDELRKYVSSTQDLGVKYIMTFSNTEYFKKTSKNASEFFIKLKALKNAGYLECLTVELKGINGEIFSHDMLSEGEKQLSLLYLLTTFTAQDNCLYIFDEFDAYLHLNWQRLISQMLYDIQVNGHIIFTTHSPGTISQIRSDELYIMKDGCIVYPESETFNRALDEIMLEQMNITMRPPHIEALYDEFKQCIADRNKEEAEMIMLKLMDILDANDPLFVKLRLVLRRI